MVRSYKRKTDIDTFLENDMREAVNLVLNGLSLRKAAAQKKVKFQTLSRCV